jgi:hypothetical protein
MRAVAKANDNARRAYDAFDYAAAARYLETVPEHHRDAKFYAEMCRRRNRLPALQKEIRAAAQELRFGKGQFAG